MTTAYEVGQQIIPYHVFKKDFFPVAKWLVEKQICTHTEKELLLILNSYSFKNGKCFPGIKTIAEKIDLSERQVIRLLMNLEAKGILQIDRPNLLEKHLFRRHNYYSFLWTVYYEMYLSEIKEMSPEKSTEMSGCYKESPEIPISKKPAEPVLSARSNIPTPQAAKEDIPLSLTATVKPYLAEIQNLTKDLDRQAIAQGKRFDSARFTGSCLKRNIHPQAVVDALSSVKKNLPAIQDVWGYAERILQIRSGNFHERDHVRASQALKQETADPAMAGFLNICLKSM